MTVVIHNSSLHGPVPPQPLADQTVASKSTKTGLCIGYASGDNPILVGLRYSLEPTFEHKPVLHEQDLTMEAPFPWTAVLLVRPLASQGDVLLALDQFRREVMKNGVYLGVDLETGARVFSQIDSSTGIEVLTQKPD